MKFRNLRNWDDPLELEGLVFFAQLVEELLFDYTLDTYKPSAMNSSSLCAEALALIQDIEDAVLDQANLKHVLAELSESLSRDEVAQALIPPALRSVGKELTNESGSLRTKRLGLEMLFSHLLPSKYKAENENRLLDAVANGNEKKRIKALARSYITTLLNMGYSSSYLYPTARQFFFLSDKKIGSADDLKRFFQYFPGEFEDYKAVFRVDGMFSEIRESCGAFDIKISDKLDEGLQEIVRNRGYSKEEGETYLIVDRLSAMDVHAARTAAESRVETVSTLLSLFHHKEAARWQPSAILMNLKTEKARFVTEPKNPMLKCADLRTDRAAERLNSFIDTFSLAERKSFDRFFRASELHGSALRNDEAESQLLNLWIALETLIPSTASSGKAKINVIASGLLPFLTVSYVPRLIETLRRDIFQWSPRAARTILSQLEGAGEDEQIFRLLVAEDAEGSRKELLERFGEFYLLRNRFHYLRTNLSNPKKLLKLLKAHWLKVDWQLRRIYRTRNTIVHAGTTPGYIDVLIKNLHDYFDTVTNTIILLASDGDRVNTIDQAFEYVDLAAKSQFASLSELDGTDWQSCANLIFKWHAQSF